MAQQLVPTSTVSVLTGLSTAKLREWTNRRALIPADILPQGKGSSAQFTWQTVLVLRVAVVLRERFHVELQAHKSSFNDLCSKFRATSFPALWGCRAALNTDSVWSICPADELVSIDAIALGLDPHLEVIRDGFAFRDVEASPLQRDLFSLPNLHNEKSASTNKVATSQGRRTA